MPTVPVLVHELGHVLDETLGFTTHADPVSWYARGDRQEAFAEAFTAWLIPGYADRPDADTIGPARGPRRLSVSRAPAPSSAGSAARAAPSRTAP